MSQLVSQTVTYGFDTNAFSISTHSTDGVLRIMKGDPHDATSTTEPIIDIHSDKSVHFYGQINSDNGKGFLTTATADTKYLGIKAQAESAKTAVDAVKKSGNRDALAGYETISIFANAITINATSADDQICTGAVTITVPNGYNNQTWQKNVTIMNAGATISPGSKWKWVGGKAPELKENSMLVCKWVGVLGFLSLITTE